VVAPQTALQAVAPQMAVRRKRPAAVAPQTVVALRAVAPATLEASQPPAANG
jgi:hypothetical protein